MKSPKSPCNECTERHLHCHSECEKYKQYRKELDEYNEMIRKAKKERDDYNDYLMEVMRKRKKKRNQK